MPLPLAHGFVGAGLVAALHPTSAPNQQMRTWKPLLAGAFLAICPDFDFFFEWVLHWPHAHRSFTHSLLMAVGVGALLIGFCGTANRREAIAYSLAFLSHTLLDFATTQVTEGVQWLWPFSTEGYKLGWWSFSEFNEGFGSLEMLLTSLMDLLYASLIELLVFGPFFLLVLVLQARRSHLRQKVT